MEDGWHARETKIKSIRKSKGSESKAGREDCNGNDKAVRP
jgi:hypothetical protein